MVWEGVQVAAENGGGAAELEVHVLVDEDALDAVVEELGQFGDDVRVEGTSEVQDPTGTNLSLGFGIDVKLLMNAVFFTGKLAGVVWRALRKRRKCIRIDSPLGSAEFCPEHGMSEDQIREKLRQLAEVL